MSDNEWFWSERLARRQATCDHWFQPKFTPSGRHYVCACCGLVRKSLALPKWGKLAHAGSPPPGQDT